MKKIFISALSDFGIKKLFGTKDNKDLLIDFLNSLLNDKKKIVDLYYLNNERYRKSSVHRASVYDLFCITSTGEYFIIELQRAPQHFIKSRSLYYSAIAFQEQALPGDWKFDLNETYMICLLDFCFDDTHSEQIIHTIKLMEEETGEVFDETLTQIMVEMPKFKKQESELLNRKEAWLYVLKNLANLTVIPVSLQDDFIFEKVFEVALLSNLTKEEMNAYELTLKDQRDYKNTLDYAKDQGDKSRQIAIAVNMILKEYPLDEIRDLTGLSIEELKELAGKYRNED